MRTWPALEVSRLNPRDEAQDLLPAALVDYRIAAIEETSDDRWRVFFNDDAERDRAAAHLNRQFPDLSLLPLDIPDEDWVSRSQADLRAVTIGNLVIAPPWDVPRTAEDGSHQVVIVIKPSMGFGTGHHATTRLCLSALQRFDLRGKSAIDIGTGSGVLAIAASRLGAAPVVGIDDDGDALQAAEENVALNRANVTLTCADLRLVPPGTFDIVTANLTGALLIDAGVRLHGLAKSGANMILSGFLQQEESDVMAAYADCVVTHRAQEEEWVCVSVQRP